LRIYAVPPELQTTRPLTQAVLTCPHAALSLPWSVTICARSLSRSSGRGIARQPREVETGWLCLGFATILSPSFTRSLLQAVLHKALPDGRASPSDSSPARGGPQLRDLLFQLLNLFLLLFEGIDENR